MAKTSRKDTSDKARPSGYNPFLKAEHLPKEGTTFFKSTGFVRNSTGDYGPQIIVEVQHEESGELYDLAVRDGSPNHRMLWRELGNNERAWGRARIGLEVQRFELREGGMSNPAVTITSVDSIARR